MRLYSVTDEDLVGIEKGISIRLACGYKVVRRDDDKTDCGGPLGHGHHEHVGCCCYLPGTELALSPPTQTDSSV